MYYRSRDPIINALIRGGAFNFKISSTYNYQLSSLHYI